jgi:hypothetical protein
MSTMKIRVTIGELKVTARLDDTKTACLLAESMPFESSACRWGDEVYFSAPAEVGEEDPQADAPVGAVAYWPPGKAMCLFFGQTPYSPVNIVGAIEGDARRVKSVQDGEPVRVEPL